MKRITLEIGLTLFAIGCGNQPPSKQFTSAELNKMADDRMKTIADDKSLSDAECFKKYFDGHAEKPSVMLPKEISPWTDVKPVGGGYHLTVHDVPNPFQAGATIVGPPQVRPQSHPG